MGKGKDAWDQIIKILPIGPRGKKYDHSIHFMANSIIENKEWNVSGNMNDIQTGSSNVLLKVLLWYAFGVKPDHEEVILQPSSYSPFDEFELELKPSANVISSLMEIQKTPINKKGERVTPVAWQQGCLEEVCGSCSMLVNGKPRQACTALIENYLISFHSDSFR